MVYQMFQRKIHMTVAKIDELARGREVPACPAKTIEEGREAMKSDDLIW